jgi:hypothetical protein
MVDLGNSVAYKEKDTIISDDSRASVDKGKIILVFKLMKAYVVNLYEGVKVRLRHS